MTKVLIFTGAGASVPLGLPTTAEFNEEISAKSQKITTLTRQYLKEYGNDIEKLLSTLEEFGNSSGLTGFLIEQLPYFTVSQKNHNIPIATSQETNIHAHLKNHITQLQSETYSELKRIKSIVYRKLQSFDKTKAYELYKNLINEIKTEIPDCSISYATANYDLTLDHAIENESFFTNDTGITDVDYGFTGKRGRYTYNPSTEYEWPSNQIEYLKVHGSLDWHPSATSEECVKSGSSVNPQNPDDMIILYPGFKGIPSREPFISLHNKLEERLKTSDIVIIIGFAFRDPFINSLFENSIKQSQHKKYLLINPTPATELPDDSIVGRLKTYNNFIHIEEKLTLSEQPLNLKQILKDHTPDLLITQDKKNKKAQPAYS